MNSRCSRASSTARRRLTVVGLAVKLVGEPDAGNPHVRFDERGVETERWPQAPSHRATPRLYRHDAWCRTTWWAKARSVIVERASSRCAFAHPTTSAKIGADQAVAPVLISA